MMDGKTTAYGRGLKSPAVKTISARRGIDEERSWLCVRWQEVGDVVKRSVGEIRCRIILTSKVLQAISQPSCGDPS